MRMHFARRLAALTLCALLALPVALAAADSDSALLPATPTMPAGADTKQAYPNLDAAPAAEAPAAADADVHYAVVVNVGDYYAINGLQEGAELIVPGKPQLEVMLDNTTFACVPYPEDYTHFPIFQGLRVTFPGGYDGSSPAYHFFDDAIVELMPTVAATITYVSPDEKSFSAAPNFTDTPQYEQERHDIPRILDFTVDDSTSAPFGYGIGFTVIIVYDEDTMTAKYIQISNG